MPDEAPPIDTMQDQVLAAAKRLGFTLPDGHEKDYVTLCGKTDALCKQIMAEPDYLPVVDYDKFPRTETHLPSGEDNPLRAWAWRTTCGDPSMAVTNTLKGKTVVLKDTICMAKVPLLFGTNAFEDFTPTVDATLVTRVLEHGGIILGKAACENFSHGATSSSSPHGPVENPYGIGFTTGGSSSGCGALVGSDQADMAVGGDQGGSIRIPACYCGLVGLKPTFGLVPYTGVLSSDPGLDHVGPMTKSVEDAAALLQAIAGYDNIDDRQLGAPLPENLPNYIGAAAPGASIKGLKIGILKEAFAMKLVSKSVDTLVRGAIAQMEKLGAEASEVSIPTFSMTSTLSHIINKMASGVTRQGRQVGRRQLYLNEYWSKLLPWDQDKYDKAKYFVTGTAMSCEYAWAAHPTAYGKAMNITRRMRDEFDELFKTYDVIVMPTCPTPPRRHIPEGAGPLLWAEHAPGASSITAGANLTGHPALTVPVGLSAPMSEDIACPSDKEVLLPVGMMLTGKYFDETTLFKFAKAYEESCDWKSCKYVD